MTAAAAPDPLLSVSNLRVEYVTRAGIVHAVNDVSLAVAPGEALGLVGESGSGKSVTAQAVMGLVSNPGRIVGGDVRWRGRSLLGSEGQRYGRSVRGKELAIVFQDPMTSLNPLMSVGAQLNEVLRHHLRLTRAQARRRAIELLGAVGIQNPAGRLDQHSHELSGGIRQRVMIAMAIACEPDLLIADEPTTALDVTIQAQILNLLGRLQEELKLAIVLITHDLGVVAGLCHRVSVMYAGTILETGSVGSIFRRPAHPYTQALLRSAPGRDRREGRLLTIDGAPPALFDPPSGCPFLPRCPIGNDRCRMPPPHITRSDGWAACWKAGSEAWLEAKERAVAAVL